jgi:transglutaminase-like putative cysteine protease
MKSHRYKLCIVAGFLFCITLKAQNKELHAEKEPSWVTINAIDYSNSRLDHEAEDGYVDLVYEKQVSLEQQSIYYKIAIKIISEAGVQNKSEISISFDPSYEKLIFHSIKIIRGKESINKLQLGKIKIIQKETELDKHIYNEALSAVLLLEDVRKEDIIEYSYTRKGFNSIFKGKYSDRYGTVFSSPVCNLYYKIIVPADRTITIKNRLTGIQPLIKRSFNETAYEWKQDNISALHVQDNLPSWYDPYPEIMLSEYKDWKEVNGWAMQLFPFNNKLSPGLQKKVDDIRMRFTSSQEQILAALRFVQDDVRYMGIEMGENSHKPHPPEKVLAQRFGDCKDKSYLLCTLLRGLGIEANPVLINTDYKKSISSWLPAATAFDHVTVRIKLNDSSFFFDPTIPYQRGAMADISYPDYQCGLVISNSTTDLADIPMHEKGIVKIKEVFNIPNMSGNVQLIVTTAYSGSFADDIRNDFNDNSRYEMLKEFQEYYATYFDKIKGDSLSFEDNDSTGIFITKEYYTIPDLWKIEEGKKKAHFESFVIDGIIKKPADLTRNMPFSIRFPARYKEDIEINLPEEWDASESSNKIACANFLMKADFSYSYRKILLQYEYESYKDNVSPDEAPKFLESYNRTDKLLAYVLTWENDNKINMSMPENKNQNGSTNFFTVLVILIIVGVVIWWTQRK